MMRHSVYSIFLFSLASTDVYSERLAISCTLPEGTTPIAIS
jgi:hypothetical protein